MYNGGNSVRTPLSCARMYPESSSCRDTGDWTGSTILLVCPTTGGMLEDRNGTKAGNPSLPDKKVGFAGGNVDAMVSDKFMPIVALPRSSLL